MTIKKDDAINTISIEFEELANLVLLQLDYLEAQMLSGELVEYDKTKNMFTNPQDKRTEEYLTGKFG